MMGGLNFLHACYFIITGIAQTDYFFFAVKVALLPPMFMIIKKRSNIFHLFFNDMIQ
jgi:hypothetical protein